MLPRMRKTVVSAGLLCCLVLLISAAPALAFDGGTGTYGESTDKQVTNAGFIMIAGFPLIIFLASMLQWQLEKRKDARKKAAKARVARADKRGGW
jgi:hypothetical protein